MEALNTDVRQIEIGPLESLTFKNFITHRKLYIQHGKLLGSPGLQGQQADLVVPASRKEPCH